MQCIQQKLAATVEVGEGGFVRGQQAAHALAREALRKAAPAVAQGHHEDVNLGAHAAQEHRDLAPVALRLLARASLESALRDRSGGRTALRTVS